MKDIITPQMIDKCIELVKNTEYDGDTFTLDPKQFGACSLTQILFPEILDLALSVLKRQARLTPLVTFVEIKVNPRKTRDKKIIPITLFQSRKEQFSK